MLMWIPFYLLSHLEDKGIKTVGIMDEHIGKVYTDPKADAIVSVGETSTIIELPPMDKVIGDDESLVRDYYYGAWSTHTTLGAEPETGPFRHYQYICAGMRRQSGGTAETGCKRILRRTSSETNSHVYKPVFRRHRGGQGRLRASSVEGGDRWVSGNVILSCLKDAEITHTIICGDNFMTGHRDEAIERMDQFLGNRI